MPINRSADIALRILITLSGRSSQKITISQLAQSIAVPQRYVGKLVQRLATIGWVLTTRGRGGGLAISADGSRATPAEVIQVLGDGWPDIDCHQPPCPLLAKGCGLRELLGRADAAFMATLGQVSMRELG